MSPHQDTTPDDDSSVQGDHRDHLDPVVPWDRSPNTLYLPSLLYIEPRLGLSRCTRAPKLSNAAVPSTASHADLETDLLREHNPDETLSIIHHSKMFDITNMNGNLTGRSSDKQTTLLIDIFG